ncbi:MAG: hypothetical protein RMX68_029150 [Aulosira sp. ZfuVER01]|nr:hypothetical protein [Aulosira sp. ZfuVER01]MDZ8002151.1 hypothetical protein [Aulosira sp. DedVER01a]MDZ8052582.1 hypothetical protein [Aulosira sp. ZfuCHP01]
MKKQFFKTIFIASVTVGLLANIVLNTQSILAKPATKRSLTGGWVLGFAEGNKQQPGINLNSFRGGFAMYELIQKGNKVNIFDIWGAPGPQGEITKDIIKFPPSYPVEDKCLLNSKIIKQGNVILFLDPCPSYGNAYPVMIRLGIPSCPRKKDFPQILNACKIPK